jgi:hypothetical protein
MAKTTAGRSSKSNAAKKDAELRNHTESMKTQKNEPISKATRATLERLRERVEQGEIVFEERSYFGPLPQIRLAKRTRLDRIVKVAKR